MMKKTKRKYNEKYMIENLMNHDNQLLLLRLSTWSAYGAMYSCHIILSVHARGIKGMVTSASQLFSQVWEMWHFCQRLLGRAAEASTIWCQHFCEEISLARPCKQNINTSGKSSIAPALECAFHSMLPFTKLGVTGVSASEPVLCHIFPFLHKVLITLHYFKLHYSLLQQPGVLPGFLSVQHCAWSCQQKGVIWEMAISVLPFVALTCTFQEFWKTLILAASSSTNGKISSCLSTVFTQDVHFYRGCTNGLHSRYTQTENTVFSRFTLPSLHDLHHIPSTCTRTNSCLTPASLVNSHYWGLIVNIVSITRQEIKWWANHLFDKLISMTTHSFSLQKGSLVQCLTHWLPPPNWKLTTPQC